MSLSDFSDSFADSGLEEVEMKPVKLEPPGFGGSVMRHVQNHNTQQLQKSTSLSRVQECEEERSSNAPSSGRSGMSMLDQGQSPSDDTGLSSTSHLCPAPICRQFWKAGNYNDGTKANISIQNGNNYLHVHPMFLHSNATSHKWAFGALAELLDNAVDEVQNGATFVNVDKTINPRDGSAALLIQDDGGGMEPEGMRRCMSFGFSDKKEKTAIGRYGNGFKTSTMRLGADVIVFSCHLKDGVMTQSIGLLSYTFLMRMGYDRIVVPMVDYKLNASTGTMEVFHCHDKEHFKSNLSMLMQWSPYSSEADLLQQFEDIGSHGTKVIIYNLWCNDSGNVELDFDSDPEDIRINGDKRKVDTLPAWKSTNEQHIANRLQYSLRAYLSILYLRMPENFSIILRGQIVEHHNIADELKFIEYILYRPQIGGFIEGQVVTTIGFLKEAPLLNIHGFNVYHKNRLILPFWPVVSYADSRGRGVVGVLEANFIEPIHNKQDFERTSLFQKLEVRLKEMTWEYWDYHCGLIGYLPKKKPRVSAATSDSMANHIKGQPFILNQTSYGPSRSRSKLGSLKQKMTEVAETTRSHADEGGSMMVDDWATHDIQPIEVPGDEVGEEEATNLVQERNKLRAQCLEYEKSEKELNEKLSCLMTELEEAQAEYARLLDEAKSFA
ncbi:protein MICRORCHIDIA 6 isoform X1 [Punica granatum]|uniref:Protein MICRORCHIDIA 6 isoform X1 n=3 Tax=Punica granatum TaxID=22663 RepID=A0A6P8EDW9_PUNGR|nr:protein MICRORCHIDIA 6 isoform X1 [Punica granatum]